MRFKLTEIIMTKCNEIYISFAFHTRAYQVFALEQKTRKGVVREEREREREVKESLNKSETLLRPFPHPSASCVDSHTSNSSFAHLLTSYTYTNTHTLLEKQFKLTLMFCA